MTRGARFLPLISVIRHVPPCRRGQHVRVVSLQEIPILPITAERAIPDRAAITLAYRHFTYVGTIRVLQPLMRARSPVKLCMDRVTVMIRNQPAHRRVLPETGVLPDR